MMKLVILLTLFVWSTYGKTASEWKSRIIYQILTDRFSPAGGTPEQPCTDLRSYCGGTYKGIQQRLDYITGLGANAIWISPIVENTPGGYHGYWAKNIFELNPHFGTKQDLKDLVAECHKRDVWVMVDVVANHMGYPGACNWTDTCTDTQLQDFNGFHPFNETEHFHPLCKIRDWMNQTEVEQCWLANLPDLDTSNTFVRSTLMKWIGDLQKEYGFDGFRVDTVVEIAKPFWAEFQSAAGVFLLGEANNGDRTKYTAGYQNYMDSVFNFPLYWALRNVFNGNKTMEYLKQGIEDQRANFKDMSVLGNFVDNHDFERFLHFTPDAVRFKNALAYVMLTEGIPVLYYGSEQAFNGAGDPNNRESLWPHYSQSSDVYQFLKTLAEYRLKGLFPLSGSQDEIYASGSFLVFGRSDGERKFIAIIKKTTSRRTMLFISRKIAKYNSDKAYVNLLDKSDTMVVQDNKLHLKIKPGGQPVVYVIDNQQTTTPLPSGAPPNGSIPPVIVVIGLSVLLFTRRDLM